MRGDQPQGARPPADRAPARQPDGGRGSAATQPLSGESLGLYVHVPFCRAKCSYCHFAIDPRVPDGGRQDRYLRALTREIRAATPGPADTLYLGGGTPSLLSLDRLGALVEAARGRFALAAGAELTLEANPADLDRDGYRRLLELGVNRLSLGVQSLDDRVLSEMGRRHTAEDARWAAVAARRAGFRNLNADLILGWPGESRERWRRTLDGALALEADHVSLYLLEVEGRTALAHRHRRGLVETPEDDLVADLYQETVGRLAEAGLPRYEISNFARRGFESRHNRKYWDDASFLGFGMAAHSYRHGRRSWNHDRFATYCRAVEERGPAAAVAGERQLTARERTAEALFTGLRRSEGVELAACRARYGLDPLEEWGDGLAPALAAGLLLVSGGTMRLSDRGMLLSNEVFSVFV